MSNQTTLHFRKAGMLTTVQDGGRNGYQQFGVPVGGALDKTSAQLANEIVGNLPNNPVLEITIMGPEIEFSDACQIAIAGADISISLNGELRNRCGIIDVKKGSVLKFGRLLSGCRAYLAVGGKWQVKPWLGSASAATFDSDVLTPDSYIKKGSKLVIRNPTSIDIQSPSEVLIPPLTEVLVSVMKAPEYDTFTQETIDFFFSQKFKITVESNRMGYRLSPNLEGLNPKKEMISSGVVPSTIQITNSGQPIILMADAQTTGGYHRIANIISSDMDKVGQLKPGDCIRFELVELSLNNSG